MSKRTLLVLALLLVSVSAFAVSFGYGYTMEAFSGFNQSASSRLSLAVDLTDSRYLTLEAGAAAGFRDYSMIFTGFNVDLSIRTFSLTDHIFSFLFANPSIWSPKATAGVIWDDSWNLGWRFGLSVLNFIDVHFNYEFLRPFVIFDRNFSFSGWGIDLIKVSYYF